MFQSFWRFVRCNVVRSFYQVSSKLRFVFVRLLFCPCPYSLLFNSGSQKRLALCDMLALSVTIVNGYSRLLSNISRHSSTLTKDLLVPIFVLAGGHCLTLKGNIAVVHYQQMCLKLYEVAN